MQDVLQQIVTQQIPFAHSYAANLMGCTEECKACLWAKQRHDFVVLMLDLRDVITSRKTLLTQEGM